MNIGGRKEKSRDTEESSRCKESNGEEEKEEIAIVIKLSFELYKETRRTLCLFILLLYY